MQNCRFSTERTLQAAEGRFVWVLWIQQHRGDSNHEGLGINFCEVCCATDNEILDEDYCDRKALEVSLRMPLFTCSILSRIREPLENSKSCRERRNFQVYPFLTVPLELPFHSGRTARELRLRREITFRSQGVEEAQSVEQSPWRL
jgi:hypothetical protein